MLSQGVEEVTMQSGAGNCCEIKDPRDALAMLAAEPITSIDSTAIDELIAVDDYLTQGRGGQARQVTLRQVQSGGKRIYGDRAD